VVWFFSDGFGCRLGGWLVMFLFCLLVVFFVGGGFVVWFVFLGVLFGVFVVCFVDCMVFFFFFWGCCCVLGVCYGLVVGSYFFFGWWWLVGDVALFGDFCV